MILDKGLWNYSLVVYGRPGFADAALALQDTYKMDVNLLLACLWAGNAGARLDVEDLRKLEHQCEPWRREVIEVFRALRRDLKDNKDPEICRIRAAAKARELDTEKNQQKRIQAVLGPLTGQGSAPKAAENLKSYLSVLDQGMNREIQTLLVRLLTIAFEGLTEGEAIEQFS